MHKKYNLYINHLFFSLKCINNKYWIETCTSLQLRASNDDIKKV